MTQIGFLSAALGPLVLCGLIIAFLVRNSEKKRLTQERTTRRFFQGQQAKARQDFAQALATKGIKIDPGDVVTVRGTDGMIDCSVTCKQGLLASGEYCADVVFVQFYLRPDGDPDWSFHYNANAVAA